MSSSHDDKPTSLSDFEGTLFGFWDLAGMARVTMFHPKRPVLRTLKGKRKRQAPGGGQRWKEWKDLNLIGES